MFPMYEDTREALSPTMREPLLGANESICDGVTLVISRRELNEIEKKKENGWKRPPFL